MRNEAAQDAQLNQLEAKHSTRPHITCNVTDGKGPQWGLNDSIGVALFRLLCILDPGRLVARDNRAAIAIVFL